MLEEGEPSSSFDKKKKDEPTYLIDGVEVREEDLTMDERLDIEAAALLNKDGFYTALTPIDIYAEPETEERGGGMALKIGLIISGALVIVAGIITAMTILL